MSLLPKYTGRRSSSDCSSPASIACIVFTSTELAGGWVDGQSNQPAAALAEPSAIHCCARVFAWSLPSHRSFLQADVSCHRCSFVASPRPPPPRLAGGTDPGVGTGPADRVDRSTVRWFGGRPAGRILTAAAGRCTTQHLPGRSRARSLTHTQSHKVTQELFSSNMRFLFGFPSRVLHSVAPRPDQPMRRRKGDQAEGLSCLHYETEWIGGAALRGTTGDNASSRQNTRGERPRRDKRKRTTYTDS